MDRNPMYWKEPKKCILDSYINADTYIVCNGQICHQDDVPVRKFFIISQRENISENLLHEHFSKFKIVESLTFQETRKKNKTTYWCGFVVFATYDNMDPILNNSNHASLSIDVLVADPWLQPDYKELYEAPFKDLEPKLNQLSLDTFFDMSLWDIESILEEMDFPTRINTSLSHPKIRQIFNNYYGRKFKHLDFDDVKCLTLMEFRHLLQLVGNRVERLTGILPRVRCITVVNLIDTYCTALQSFDLYVQEKMQFYKREILPVLNKNLSNATRGRLRYQIVRN